MQTGSFSVNDRATTPVAHTFTPRGAPTGMARFAEAGPTAIGEKTLSVRWRDSETRRNVRLTFAVPVVVTETINGVNRVKVERTSFVDANFRFDTMATEQERKDTVGMFANMLAASVTVIDKTLTGLEDIW